MSFVPINWRPDDETLAGFSEAWMFFLGMVAAPLFLIRGRFVPALCCWVLGLIGRGIGLLRPRLLKPLFVGMTLGSWPIGWLVSHAALAVLYYAVITPIGLVSRAMGRDPLMRRFDRSVDSYWEGYNPGGEPERYLRQF